jgi:hypothetical protein
MRERERAKWLQRRLGQIDFNTNFLLFDPYVKEENTNL